MSLAVLNKELNAHLAEPAVVRALLATTFKGLEEKTMKQAALEAMMRGYKFKDFLEKNVYAIPFKDGYSLVTSIDHARKIGMRSGVIGKSAPHYDYDEADKLESCTVTIKRRVGQDVGEYTATVYLDEYTTGRNLWTTKPKTMLAKVAEMHALRMACPEEMKQLYTEEEFDKQKEEEEFDASPIAEDAPVLGGGDDTPGMDSGDEQEIPEDEAAQLNLLTAKAMKKWPDLDPKSDMLGKKVKDLVGIPLEPKNYKTIIKMLG